MSTSRHRLQSILQNRNQHGLYTFYKMSLTCRKHIKHFLCFVADLKSKSFANNDVPTWTKLLVKNFL